MENPFRDDSWKTRENPFLYGRRPEPPINPIKRFFWRKPIRKFFFIFVPVTGLMGVILKLKYEWDINRGIYPMRTVKRHHLQRVYSDENY